MNTNQHFEVQQYIARIRHPEKQRFAAAYLAHKLGLTSEPDRNGLSMMAAQAVRSNINGYFLGKGSMTRTQEQAIIGLIKTARLQ